MRNKDLKDLENLHCSFFDLNGGFLQGASMLFKKETIKKIGLFDEKMFMMFDESELCMRILRNKMLLYCACNSKVYHKEGNSRGTERITQSFLFLKSERSSYNTFLFNCLYFRNMCYAIQKHYSLKGIIIFLILNLPTIFRIIVGIILFDESKLKRLKLFLKALYDGFKGKVGKPYWLEK